MKNLQKGSATVTVLLIIIIVLVIGFVFYIHHENKKVVPMTTNSQLGTPIGQNTPTTQIPAPTTSSQTTSTTSDTKTYTNTQYGFQFKYQSGVTLSGNEDAASGLSGRMHLVIEDSNGSGYMDLYAIASTGYAAQPGGNTCPQDYGTQGYTNVTINGLNFTKGDVSGNYESMNASKAQATEYCTIGSNGDKYTLTQVNGTGGSILNVINSFTLIK